MDNIYIYFSGSLQELNQEILMDRVVKALNYFKPKVINISVNLLQGKKSGVNYRECIYTKESCDELKKELDVLLHLNGINWGKEIDNNLLIRGLIQHAPENTNIVLINAKKNSSFPLSIKEASKLNTNISGVYVENLKEDNSEEFFEVLVPKKEDALL